MRSRAPSSDHPNDPDDHRYWCAVGCREHVECGHKEGFAQVCHGRRQPLSRMRPQDGIVYYSPTERLGGGPKCQKFTSIGIVKDDRIYQCEMAPAFVPFRRDVEYFEAAEVHIRLLLPHLSFTKSRTNWGYVFRSGLFEIKREDFILILAAMNMKLCRSRYGEAALRQISAGLDQVKEG